MLPAIPILQEYARLQKIHTTSKIDNSVFQPNREEQNFLILKNFSVRYIKQILKRETIKYVYKESHRRRHSLKRAQSALGIVRSYDPFDSVQSSFQQVFDERPHTVSTTTQRKNEFSTTLKSFVTSETFTKQLKSKKEQQILDAKKVFDSLCTNFKPGAICQFQAKNDFELIDVTELVQSQQNYTSGTLSRLEDISQLMKKDGMALVFDPSTDTQSAKITLKISYLKAIDLVNEETVVREHEFWSDGNYFGISLTSEANKTYTDFSNTFQHLEKCNLPGWNGKVPIFIPASKCTLQVINTGDTNSTLEYNLSRIRIFALICSHTKNGVKKLQEFTDEYFTNFTANLAIHGGMSALNLGCLHGNMEAVVQLVENGAGINIRNTGSKLHTPLHEAVIGGHPDVAKYLLDKGANQLVRDESGCCPLHLACRLGHVAILKILINSPGGKKALLCVNNNDEKPIDTCNSNFMKSRVEDAMKNFKIFAKPRVSIMERS